MAGQVYKDRKYESAYFFRILEKLREHSVKDEKRREQESDKKVQ